MTDRVLAHLRAANVARHRAIETGEARFDREADRHLDAMHIDEFLERAQARMTGRDPCPATYDKSIT